MSRSLQMIIAVMLASCVSGGLRARALTDAQVQDYIDTYKATALRFEKEYGIPAAITLAQAILESGAGTSGLTRASNNHFCIKAGSSWTGPVYLAWDDEADKSRFRSYTSAQESYRDYARLISTSRYYRALFDINVYDYRGWAHGLKKAGYATAPNYATALIGIIDKYKLYALNGGVKLKPGKNVVVIRQVESEEPVFDDDCVQQEDVVSEEENLITEAAKYEAVEINDVPCTVLKPGEDLHSISRRHNISGSDLLKYNEIVSTNQLHEGDIVFLNKKKKKYQGPRDVYVAAGGETLHSVSQKFGVMLSTLAKINGLDPYSRLADGDIVRLK